MCALGGPEEGLKAYDMYKPLCLSAQNDLEIFTSSWPQSFSQGLYHGSSAKKVCSCLQGEGTQVMSMKTDWFWGTLIIVKPSLPTSHPPCSLDVCGTYVVFPFPGSRF